MTDDIRRTLCHKSGQTKVQRWLNKVDLRAEWPLQGIQSAKVASGRCSPISTNHVALFGLSCTRLGLVSTLHLALAIFQQGAPCFGDLPKLNTQQARMIILGNNASPSPQIHAQVVWLQAE